MERLQKKAAQGRMDKGSHAMSRSAACVRACMCICGGVSVCVCVLSREVCALRVKLWDSSPFNCSESGRPGALACAWRPASNLPGEKEQRRLPTNSYRRTRKLTIVVIVSVVTSRKVYRADYLPIPSDPFQLNVAPENQNYFDSYAVW